jgi:hypothetical protein
MAQAMQKALRGGDHETVRAAMNQLTNMGAAGNNAIYDVLADSESPVYAGGGLSADMQTTVRNSINENYPTLVSKVGDVAKGGFDESGTFSTVDNEGKAAFSKLSADQLAGQTPQAIKRNLAHITPQMASEILSNPNLRAKIADGDVLRDLQTIGGNGGGPLLGPDGRPL